MDIILLSKSNVMSSNTIIIFSYYLRQKNSKILYLFEALDGVINHIEGECQVFSHFNDDDKIDYALIITKPDEKVFVDWEEYYQDKYKRWIYNRWISSLIDGYEIPHPIEHRRDIHTQEMAVSC